MATSRYNSTEQREDEDGNRVFKTTIYPDLDGDASEEIIIELEKGRRLDLLANEYLNDPELWWVIAEANNLGRGTLYVEAGQQIRIPTEISRVYTRLRNKNENR